MVLLARPAALGRGLPGRPDDLRPHLPLRLRHPGRRRRRLRLHLRRAGPRPPPPSGLRLGLRHRRRRPPDGCPCTGRSTTSWGSGAETARRLWDRRGRGSGRGRPAAGLRRLLPLRLLLARGARAVSRRGGPPFRARTAASTATARAASRALSGGGALGNGRMHGVPQMLECYLQLSGRAGERQRERAPSGWRAMPRRTSAAPSSTAPSPSEQRAILDRCPREPTPDDLGRARR